MKKKVFNLNKFNSFKKNGFIKINIKNLNNLLDNIEKEMINICLNVSKKLNIKFYIKEKKQLEIIKAY